MTVSLEVMVTFYFIVSLIILYYILLDLINIKKKLHLLLMKIAKDDEN